MSDNKSTKTMDGGGGVATGEPTNQPRFLSSGIGADGYEGTRVRRWGAYQRSAIRKRLKRAEEQSDGDKKKQLLASILSTCLVRKERKVGTALLFRAGIKGAQKLAKELSVGEMRAAIATCVRISKIDD